MTIKELIDALKDVLDKNGNLCIGIYKDWDEAYGQANIGMTIQELDGDYITCEDDDFIEACGGEGSEFLAIEVE